MPGVGSILNFGPVIEQGHYVHDPPIYEIKEVGLT